MNPDIPPPDDAPNEVGVVVGDAEVVDGRDCFGRADRSNLDQPTIVRNQLRLFPRTWQLCAAEAA